jgi:hypothetical protein
LATKSCFFAVWSTFNTMMELQVLDPGEFTWVLRTYFIIPTFFTWVLHVNPTSKHH